MEPEKKREKKAAKYTLKGAVIEAFFLALRSSSRRFLSAASSSGLSNVTVFGAHWSATGGGPSDISLAPLKQQLIIEKNKKSDL
jgi:hypothetical protein